MSIRTTVPPVCAMWGVRTRALRGCVTPSSGRHGALGDLNSECLGRDELPFKVATPCPEGEAFLSTLLMTLWATYAEILHFQFWAIGASLRQSGCILFMFRPFRGRPSGRAILETVHSPHRHFPKTHYRTLIDLTLQRRNFHLAPQNPDPVRIALVFRRRWTLESRSFR